MPGTLYVVATPIGNLEDVTLRALRVLREVALICAEDTRVTRKLLSRYDIHTPLTSFHEHTGGAKRDDLVARLTDGEDLALVTDAGTPCISDPGHMLVAAAIDAGAVVIPVPGPSAAAAAMSVSGMQGGRYAFDGFPPRGRSDRRAFFEALREESRPIVLYEAPTRVRSTLRELHSALGNRCIVVARELTKRYETVFRGTIESALEMTEPTPCRGEHTLVIAPAERGEAVIEDDQGVESRLSEALRSGARPPEAARIVAQATGRPRGEVYTALLRMRRERG